MDKKINIVFMGGFTYPGGMAGTKRIQNAIMGLKEYRHLAMQVILQRQTDKDNSLSGIYEGTPYETVMEGALRARMLVALPLLYYRTIAALRKAYRPNYKNVIYFYGPLFLESIVPLKCARRSGYKIIFDVIEDYDLSMTLTRSFYNYLKSNLAAWFSSQISDLCSGLIVISSHLEAKYKTLIKEQVPIHYMPISVNMDYFCNPMIIKTNPTISLFYGGTFGKKDGIPILLKAFDRLAGRHEDVHLVLTGQGNKRAMEEFYSLIEKSPHKNRIEFKGYLDEKDYYSLLNEADIPCMTRIDHAYVNAGFPFKLGEFLATGKPVVASRVSDVERFLVHGVNAMLVRPGSSEEICEAVEFLINNPKFAEAIGMRGREVARKYFDYKQQGKGLLTFLESL